MGAMCRITHKLDIKDIIVYVWCTCELCWVHIGIIFKWDMYPPLFPRVDIPTTFLNIGGWKPIVQNEHALGMVVGCQTEYFTICSVTGIFTTISRVYKEWREKEVTISESSPKLGSWRLGKCCLVWWVSISVETFRW